MNSQLLRNHAGDLIKQAISIRNQYDFELIKTAALNSLVEGGVREDEANEILEGIRKDYVPGHAAEMLKQASTLEEEAGILTKIATVLEETDSKLIIRTAELDNLKKEASLGPALDHLKSQNFSESDLEALKSLPESTLIKIASDQGPWDLGKATNGQRVSADPLYNFLMS